MDKKEKTRSLKNIHPSVFVTAFLISLGIAVILAVIYQTNILSIPQSKYDGIRDVVKMENIQKKTTEGSIFDRNGNVIIQATEPDIKNAGTIQHPEAFSHIVGYNSLIYGQSGLRKTFSDKLYYGGDDGVGATFTLTVDTDLQLFCYDLLKGNKGAVTVINTKTGEILGMVSRSNKDVDYDANRISAITKSDPDDAKNEYDKYPGIFMDLSTTAHNPPGSTFKIITATALIDNGQEDFTITDTGVVKFGATSIRNQGNKVYGETDLQRALTNSVNTYFSQAAVNIGRRQMTDVAEKFMLGKKFSLDFMGDKQMGSNLEIGKTDADLAQVGFGQGETLMSPLHITMVMESIMNNGQMHEPYLIQSIVDDGKTIQEGEAQKKLSDVTSKKTAQKMQELLHGVTQTESYNMPEEKYGYVMAKTGTAEINNKKAKSKKQLYNKYIVMGVKNGDLEYAFCISIEDVTNPNMDLKGMCRDIVKYINTNF